VLDSDARALFRGEVQVHLTPKALDVLLLLLSLRPRAVTKAEILDRVWPGTFVTDASLARTIHEIRSELGDHATTPIIRTVHGHGYAFAAEATDLKCARDSSVREAAPGWLVMETRAVPLAAGDQVIGRDPAVAIPVDSPRASWHHARLTASAESVVIEDLGSKNGTLV
jgi:DNA-binding winged helix-turn-helix (wHTH) protein